MRCRQCAVNYVVGLIAHIRTCCRTISMFATINCCRPCHTPHYIAIGCIASVWSLLAVCIFVLLILLLQIRFWWRCNDGVPVANVTCAFNFQYQPWEFHSSNVFNKRRLLKMPIGMIATSGAREAVKRKGFMVDGDFSTGFFRHSIEWLVHNLRLYRLFIILWFGCSAVAPYKKKIAELMHPLSSAYLQR